MIDAAFILFHLRAYKGAKRLALLAASRPHDTIFNSNETIGMQIYIYHMYIYVYSVSGEWWSVSPSPWPSCDLYSFFSFIFIILINHYLTYALR